MKHDFSHNFKQQTPSREFVLMNCTVLDGIFQYSCSICSTSFIHKSNCTAHIRAVHLDQKKICKFCGKSYKKIAQHITEVHGSNQVKCTQCEEQFVSKRFLKRHTEVHHRTKVIPTVKTNHRSVCDVCEKSVLSIKRNKHIEMNHLLPPDFSVPCPLCNVWVKFLPFHINKFHKDLNIRRDCYPCRKCRRYFNHLSDLRRHEVNHCVYKCYECGKEYAEFLDLGWHCYQDHCKVFNLGGRSRTKQKGNLMCPDLSKSKLYAFKPVTSRTESEDEVHSFQKLKVLVNSNGVVDQIWQEHSGESEGESVDDPKETTSDFFEKNLCADGLEDEITYYTLETNKSSLSENIDKTRGGNDQEEVSSFILEVESITDDSLHESISEPKSTIEIELGEEETSFKLGLAPLSSDEMEALAGGNQVADPEYVAGAADEGRELRDLDTRYFYIKAFGDEDYIAVEDIQFEEEVGQDRDQTNQYVGRLEEEEEEKVSLETSLEERNGIQSATKPTEKKINQVFSSKQNVPRDVQHLSLDVEDESLLRKLAHEDGIDYKDLPRLQISSTPQDKSDRVPENRHRFVDSRQAHICPYCRLILKTRYTLQKHISVRHFKNKPFPCSVCHKYFSTNADLRKHMKNTHEQQEMVPCGVCGKEFRSGYIRRHKQSAHSQNVQSQCNLCLAVFKNREVMLQHRRKKHK